MGDRGSQGGQATSEGEEHQAPNHAEGEAEVTDQHQCRRATPQDLPGARVKIDLALDALVQLRAGQANRLPSTFSRPSLALDQQPELADGRLAAPQTRRLEN